MADVRCPMCGKPNPEELDACKFCQARLKPLYIGQSGDVPAAPARLTPPQKSEPAQGAEALDWMQSFRQSEAGGDEQPEALQEEPPDWLSGFRDQPAGLDKGQPDMPGKSASGKAAEESASWLGDLRSDFSPLNEADSGEPGGTTDDDQDWLGRLVGQAREDQPAPAEELPDWLTTMQSAAEDGGAASTSERLSQERGLPEAGEDQLPAWMAGEANELPDWLSQPDAAGLQTPQPTLPEEAGLPDWLSQGVFQAGPVSSEPEAPEAEEQVLPDWFSQPGGEGAIGDTAGAEPEKGKTLDWMTEGISEVPDWLAAAGGETPVPPDESAQAEPVKSTEEVPDWWGELESAETPAPAQIAGEKEPVAETFDQAEGDLDWLSELEAAFPDMPEEPAFSGMVGSKPPEVALIPEEGFDAGLDESLPGWLSEVVPEEKAEASGEESAASLMPADLPGWLAAMRPIESVGVEAGAPVIEGEPEKVGPLSGLRGVLPAEPDIAYINKPPTYSVKLQVTEEQKTFADLFEQLIQTEGEARPVPGRSVVTSNHVLRMVVAMVLLLAVLLPLLGGMQVSAPAVPVEEMLEINQMVTGLPANAPVLLAVDYEPGFSGEMDAVTGAVLDHLMLKGVFLALVSTSPTGPIQAEHLISTVDRISGHQYSASGQVANFGFVPGGSVGLLNFAEDPRGVFPRTLAQVDAWSEPGLQAVKSISDFALVIVATEKPETARAWIEQVQPRLGNVPLMMIVSAQAEPIVRPYYEAYPKQVQGIISGLAGGMAYETSVGRSGNARVFWAPFSIGLLVAVILTLIGGGVNALSAMMRRGKGGATGEA